MAVPSYLKQKGKIAYTLFLIIIQLECHTLTDINLPGCCISPVPAAESEAITGKSQTEALMY